MLPIESAFKVFTNSQGKPLENGYVYFGVANQNPITSPISVYWDAAGTQPATQPLRTVNGYIHRSGTPANLFVGVAYSQLVQDSRGRQVFYARTSDDFSVATVITNFISSLASYLGSTLVGFLQAGVGAVARTMQSKNRDIISVMDFGAVGDGITNDTVAIQTAIDAVADGCTLLFPAGKTFKLVVSNVGPNNWWTEDGDPALDVDYNTALAFRNRSNLTIMAQGALFDCDDEYSITFYKCVNCTWIGGKQLGDIAYKAGLLQAAAFVVMRCVNTWIEGVYVTTFYRNIWFGRSNWCGTRNCRSDDAGYFGYYASGNLDVTIAGQPAFAGVGRTSDTQFIECIGYGGKYGNFFLENAAWVNCESYNAGRQGVAAYHITTNNAGFKVTGGIIFEGSNQNSGDQVSGIAIAASGVFVIAGTDAVDDVYIGGGLIIDGGRSGIVATACSNVTIDGVFIRNFYLSGINAHTRDLSGSDSDLVNFNIGNVNVGPFKSTSTLTASTYDSKGAIIIESNDAIPIKKAMVSGTVIDGNNGGAFAPTGTWYEFKCNDSNVTVGDILIRGTGTQQRTATAYSGTVDHDIAVSGAQAITGVGFKPKRITAFSTITVLGADGASYGHMVGLGAERCMFYEPTTTNWQQTGGALVLMAVNSTNTAAADVTSLDDDGFTLNWTLVGAPTGTSRISFICER